MVRCGDEQLADIIILQRLHAFDTFSAAVLALKGIHAHPLDISQIRHGNNHVFSRYEIFHGNVKLIISDLGSSVISVLFGNHENLFLNYAKKQFPVGKNCLQLADPLHQLGVFRLDLLSFQTGQSTQTHVYDRLCLHICQSEPLHQFRLGDLDCGGSSDDPDYLVDIVKGDKQTL